MTSTLFIAVSLAGIPTCEETICNFDPYCCVEWDSTCQSWADMLCTCRADINRDHKVDGRDLGLVLGRWGTNSFFEDIDGNGIVGGEDIGILLANWGNCPN